MMKRLWTFSIVFLATLLTLSLVGTAHANVTVAQPADVTIVAGQSTTISVSAEGEDLIYQWYEGAAGDTSRLVDGATSDTLTTPALNHSVSYWVRVTGTAGTESSETITVSVTHGDSLMVAGHGTQGQTGNGYGDPAHGGRKLLASDVKAVAAGRDHTLMLKQDGSLWTQGRNNWHQLGNGAELDLWAPTRIATGVVKIASYEDSNFFIKDDGSLWAFGNNSNGQLVTNAIFLIPEPLQVATDVKDVAVGRWHCLFVKNDNTAWAAGANVRGGFGVSEDDLSGSNPHLVATGVERVAVGEGHSLFLKTNGTLWATGANDRGQVGDGTLTDRWVATMVAFGVKDIAAGEAFSLFIKNDGTLWGMGDNRARQLNPNHRSPYLRPTKIGDSVAKAAAGAWHAVYIKEDGTLVGLGRGSHELGYPTRIDGTPNVTDVAVSSNFTLYTTLDGNLWGLGSNDHGQLGGGHIEFESTGASGVVDTAAGTHHSLYVQADGTLWAMGINSVGQLGDGTKSYRTFPVPVATGVKKVSAGYTHSNFIRNDGTLWAMGSNSNGQLGFGTAQEETSPVQVATDVKSVAGGKLHTLFLKTDGTAWATGNNEHTQLGYAPDEGAPPATVAAPVQVAEDVVELAAGGLFSFFLKTDGTLWATGDNAYGQFGTGDTTDATVPVQVATDVQAVAAGNRHSLMLKNDGTLWSTGDNSAGQLGTGNETSVLEWTQIDQNVVHIDAGLYTSFHITEDGTLHGAGRNNYTQLGESTQLKHFSPVGVLADAVSVSAGDNHTIAVAKGETAPSINAFTGTVGLKNGDSLTLKVEATGEDLEFQWYLGESGDTTQPVDGANGTSHTTGPITSDVAYWVRVFNIEGTADSETAFALVQSTPEILAQPQDETIPLDTSTTLSIEATGGHLEYQWYLGEAGDTSQPVPGADSATYETATIDDQADYWVRVSNFFGTLDSDTATVTALNLPVVASHPTSETVKSGASVSLSVSATGEDLSYQWYMGATGDTSQPLDGATASTFGTPGLGHSVSYWVRVSTPFGETDSDTAVVSVANDDVLMVTGRGILGQTGNGYNHPSLVGRRFLAEDVASVSAGNHHVLILKNDGSLWAQGWNIRNQLGNGEELDLWGPKKIATGVAKAIANRYSSYFIKEDDTLWAFGDDSMGQLSTGNFFYVPEPVQVATDIKDASAGDYHSLIVMNDGTMWAAGENMFGGFGVSGDGPGPVFVTSNVERVAVGKDHSLFITTDGKLWACGANRLGQLGDGTDTNRLIPVHVASGVIDIAAGDAVSVFIKNDGSVWGMGDNRSERLRPVRYREVPSPVKIGDNGVKVVVGTEHIVFLKEDGTIGSTGGNRDRQLGSPATINGMPNVIDIAAGNEFTLFLKSDGTLWGTGKNDKGQLGGGHVEFEPTGATGIVDLATGRDHSLYVDAEGTLWAMGVNSSGQLGDGTNSYRTLPVIAATGVAEAFAGYYHSHFLKKNGTLWAMGVNDAGQLGDGSNTERMSPVQITTGVSKVVGGESHTLFLKADGTAWATGGNDYGQLGPVSSGGESPLSINTPVQIANQVADVAAGRKFSFILNDDGSLWAFGSNHYGQLGTGDKETPAFPVQVASEVGAVAAGERHSVILKTDGTVWTTGENLYGQLGTGDTSAVQSWTKIAEGVVSIGAGWYGTFYVTADGTLHAAGRNIYCQLGESTKFSLPEPVAVLSDVLEVSVGYEHTLAVVGGDKAPVINTFTNDVTSVDGQGVVLSVEATGVDLAFQWYKGESGDTAQPIASANGTSYTTKTLIVDANYWVRVWNDFGTTDSETALVEAVSAPEITVHPADTIVESGTATTLSVTATGGGLEYQWYLGESGDNATPVNEATDSTFDTPALSEDAAYWVRVSNLAGAADSETATILAQSPPTIISQPQSVTIIKGSTASFEVEAAGGHLEYRWYAGTSGDTSHPIDGATEATLETEPLEINADYWVRAFNHFGSVDSGTASVTALNLPQFTTIPEGTTIIDGQSATLSVSASGEGLSYQWYRGAAGDISHPINGGTTDSHQTPQLDSSASYWVRVSTDDGAIDSDTLTVSVETGNTLHATGLGTSGQTGTGYVNPHSKPLLIAADVADVATGDYHTLVLMTDGTLWTQGRNELRQLGTGGVINLFGLKKISAEVTKVAAGAQNSFFLRTDGSLWAFGGNLSGQLGDGTKATRPVPVPVTTGVADMEAGARHTLILKTDGTLWTVGSNAYGALGDNSHTSTAVPVQISSGVIRMAAGRIHSLFLKSDGTLWSFGANNYGQLGYGTKTQTNAPVQIATDVEDVAAGNYHSLFVTSDGSLWATGANDLGQLGDGSRTERLSPVQIATDVERVFAGTQHTLFLKTDGSLWGTGRSAEGQVGYTAHFDSIKTPKVVATGVVDAAAGETFSVFIKTDGTLWGVGGNDYGQLGGGFTTWTSMERNGMTAIAAGSHHSLFLQGDGTLWATGRNTAGQLGDETKTSRYKPVEVDAGVASIAAGYRHSLYIKEDKGLWAMGANSNGQLGINDTIDEPEPQLVIANVEKVLAGGQHTLVLTADGTVCGMGYNVYGQLGKVDPDGFPEAIHDSPVLLGEDMVDIAAGGYFSLFLKADGTVWASGQNDRGQFGTGAGPGSRTPVLVASGVAAVAAGHRHSAILKTDGTLWTAGENDDGQLGVGDTSDRYVWTQIAENVASVEANLYSTFFITADGTLWAAGDNTYAQLGDPKRSSLNTPVAVLSDVVAVSAGEEHSLALVEGERAAAIIGLTDSFSTLAGESVSLAVEATGADLSFQWYRGTSGNTSQPIGGADADSHLTQPLSADAGFWVRVSSDFGTVDSETVTVEIITAPSITNQPQSLTLVEGDEADFEVTAAGRALEYQWYLGASGDTAVPIEGATGAVLSTEPLSASIDVWVRVSNPAGSVDSGMASAEVLAVPAISSQPESVIVSPGGDASFTVVASGGGLNYQWYRGASGDTSFPVFSQMEATLDRTFVLSNQRYWARVWNLAGSVDSEAAHVLVQTEPTIVSEPESKTVVAGGATTLDVSASGGSLEYQWYFGVSGDTSQPIGGATASAYATGTLGATTNFWVRVFNGMGSADSATAVVTTVTQPSLGNLSSVKTVAKGSSVTLGVEASGGSIQYQWYKGSVGDISSPIDGANSAELTLASVAAEQLYWVRVANVAGSADSGGVIVSVVNAAYKAWEDSAGGTGNLLPIDDADGDGVLNLLEYALGGSPVRNDSEAITQTTSDDRHALFTFNSVADPDLTYFVEASDDLQVWQQIWTRSGAENIDGTVTVEDTSAASTAGRYLRLRVRMNLE